MSKTTAKSSWARLLGWMSVYMAIFSIVMLAFEGEDDWRVYLGVISFCVVYLNIILVLMLRRRDDGVFTVRFVQLREKD